MFRVFCIVYIGLNRFGKDQVTLIFEGRKREGTEGRLLQCEKLLCENPLYKMPLYESC